MRTARSRGTAGKDNAAHVPISPPFGPYDHVLLDLDGCLWLGDEALAGAVDAVAALREAGKSVLFLTNDVRHPPEGFVRKLWRLGFQASLDEVLSVGAAVQFALAERAAAAARPSSSARRRWSTTSPTPACGSSTTPSSPPAPTSWSSAATTTSSSTSCSSPPRPCCAAPS